jgi:transposase
MEFVARAARYMPLSHAGQLVRVDDATAGRWDRAILRAKLPAPKLDDLRILLIDEKAVRRHHGYVTLVMNGENGELLYLAEGKKKESLQGFFDQLNTAQKTSIRAVAMDRAGAYYQVVKEQLPKADIVFDKFHLIANYNAVIDQVRRAEWHKASAQDKHVIKGQRYNLFRRPENRTARQAQSLANLLAINRNLAVVDVLKDDLDALWQYRYPGAAVKYLRRWVDWARASGIEPLRKFARGLLKAKTEVLNFCKHRITTGPLEAFNNTVSRIIHRACGVRDLDYLFLKLRQESLDPHLQK